VGSFTAHSHISQDSDSVRAGEEIAWAVTEGFGSEKPKALLVYATINHDHADLLAGVRGVVGDDVIVAGCSAQGIMGNRNVLEGGFVAGAMGLGGEELLVAADAQQDIHVEGRRKGRDLAHSVKTQLGRSPELFILLYDPLSGLDVDHVLAGLRDEIDCPITGGAASQPSGPVVKTYQYHGTSATTRSAVGLGLCSRGRPFGAELGFCHGTVPTGVTMTLTRADGNVLLELDGRPALDVWREAIGARPDEVLNQAHTAALAMGVEKKVAIPGAVREESVYLIRAAFGFSEKTRGIVVQAAIPQGSKILFHHRTVDVVRKGTVAMGEDLARRLEGKSPWAVLAFECGARTAPFLGRAGTLEENLALQAAVAPAAPWLGLLAWGEVASLGGDPTVHNYSYPLVVLTS
jgi:hypothetical protein